MSGVAILSYQMKHNTALTNIVPAARIISGTILQGTPAPVIGITEMDGNSRSIVKNDGVEILWTERVQVTLQALSYRQQKDILKLIQGACGNVRGVINSVKCDSIVDDTVGPDAYDPEEKLYQQTQDFIVKFVE